MDRVVRVFLFAILGASLVLIGLGGAVQRGIFAQTAAGPAGLRIGGGVSTPLVLTVADLQKMPRKKLTVVNPHDKKTESYELGEDA
jgi:hypothetical protein